MGKLFDKKDILTGVTINQAVIGTTGYFADSFRSLVDCVKNQQMSVLSEIDSLHGYCFVNEDGTGFSLFLPLAKDKQPKPFRGLWSMDELFNFLMPDFDGNKAEIDKNKKAEILIGHKITLRRKEDHLIEVMCIQSVNFFEKGKDTDIYLNGNLLDNLFLNYEIKKNGEYVPFGVEE